jgi:hypothetical protein
MAGKGNLRQRSNQAREAAAKKKQEIKEVVRDAEMAPEMAADEVELSQPKHTVASYSDTGMPRRPWTGSPTRASPSSGARSWVVVSARWSR